MAPLGAFALLSLFQVAGGAITVRRGGLLTLLAGLAGAVFCAMAAWSVWAVADPVAFTVGIPPVIFWTSALPIAATCLSVVAAFRDAGAGGADPARAPPGPSSPPGSSDGFSDSFPTHGVDARAVKPLRYPQRKVSVIL